jgi:hypothetical protein
MARLGRLAAALVLICATTLAVDALAPTRASAESVPPPIGTAAAFALLAGSTITNTGNSVINGDMGVSPGTARTGFPPGQLNGTFHSADATAAQAKTDLAGAYTNAASRPTTATVATELGGTTRSTGVYDSASGTFEITGTVTLNGLGDPGAVFIFKTGSTLVTAANSAVNLINGAQACNVFWQVGSSATFGADSTMRGDVLALTSITVGARVTGDGRMLAINGAVTLDNDAITTSSCAAPGELSITAPVGASLGEAAPGGVISGALGAVTVTDTRGLTNATWTATVSATNFSTTAPVRTISRDVVSYWSGPATATTGTATFTAGQVAAGNAVFLDAPRTTFSVTIGSGTTSATWNPTFVVRPPLAAVAGSYTGTLTFSVA